MDAPYWGRAPGTPSSIYHYFMTHPPSPTLDYSISHFIYQTPVSHFAWKNQNIHMKVTTSGL